MTGLSLCVHHIIGIAMCAVTCTPHSIEYTQNVVPCHSTCCAQQRTVVCWDGVYDLDHTILQCVTVLLDIFSNCATDKSRNPVLPNKGKIVKLDRDFS